MMRPGKGPGPGRRAPPDHGAEQRVSATDVMLVQCTTSIRCTESENPLGARISLVASVMIPGLQARVSFLYPPSESGRPAEESTGLLQLVAPGDRFTQPHEIRGVPGGSQLILELIDLDGRLLAPEREAGECANGMHVVDIPFRLITSAVAWVSVVERPPGQGPLIRLDGELTILRGVRLRLIYRPAGGGPVGVGAGASEVPLIASGTPLPFRQQVLEGGLPGDPTVSMRFVEPVGRPIGHAFRLRSPRPAGPHDEEPAPQDPPPSA